LAHADLACSGFSKAIFVVEKELLFIDRENKWMEKDPNMRNPTPAKKMKILEKAPSFNV
jgi:hypothetical protein